MADVGHVHKKSVRKQKMYIICYLIKVFVIDPPHQTNQLAHLQ